MKKSILSLIISGSLLVSPIVSFASGSNYEDFEDLNSEAWYKESVEYVLNEKLFNGISEKEFSPDTNITRAMFATILGRKYKVREEDYVSKDYFDDVESNQYYTSFINWAKEEGVIEGVGDNKFNPNKPITREEAFTIINRIYKSESFSKVEYLYNDSFIYNLYRNKYLTDNEREKFEDIEECSKFSYEAISWFVKSDLITGYDGKLLPKESITRAEVAQLLMSLDILESNIDYFIDQDDLIPFDISEVESISVRRLGPIGSERTVYDYDSMKKIYDEFANKIIVGYEEPPAIDGAIKHRVIFKLKDNKKLTLMNESDSIVTRYIKGLKVKDK